MFSHLATQLVISNTHLYPTPSIASKLVVCWAMHTNSKDSSEMLNGVSSNITFAFVVDIFLKLCISIAYSGALSWAIFTISHSWLDWNYHGGFALSFSFLCGDPRPETKQTQDALTILQRKLMFDHHAWASFPGSSIFCLIWSSLNIIL